VHTASKNDFRFSISIKNVFALLETVIEKRCNEELKSIKRKLEKELEEELGDDYVLDLNKNYDLPEEYKYDRIPEFWDGHNIADYIDPEIFKVRSRC
jgi:nucleolar GTP-binding protein